jgi:hypothetical protein
MNKQKWIILIAALGLLGGAAALLDWLRPNQRLGLPGVKTSPLAGTQRLQVELPQRALDYDSESVKVTDVVLGTLPADTSFGQRDYKAADGFEVLVNVVLMGCDRTSLHKPQFCLRGGGWVIQKTEPAMVAMTRPYEYDLPVTKLTVSPEKPATMGDRRGVYVYWYVADGAISASATGFQRMWWMAKHMLRTGVLQRWAYVSYFAVCPPGREEATFERMKKLIAASVPDFQLTPRPAGTTVTARQ